jgi:hypothetical protein
MLLFFQMYAEELDKIQEGQRARRDNDLPV